MAQPPKYTAIKRAALALPGASEVFHHGPHFNIGTKTFVLYWIPEERWIFKLPKAQQLMLFDVRPDTFSPMTHGRLLWSYVKVEDVGRVELRDLVIAAWRTVATKKLQSSLDQAPL